MKIKKTIFNLVNKLPYINGLYQENMQFKRNSCFPAGHFYSPIVSVDEIKNREIEIWKNSEIDGIQEIDLRTEEQINLLKTFTRYYSELPFKTEKQSTLRYYFDNNFYSYTDGIILYSFLRHFKPERIIEIGSGFSTAVMLDTNQLFFGNQIQLTCIEPNPQRLYSLMSEIDRKQVTVFESDVQLVHLDEFKKLKAGDILFVDSSHIVKTGSDVNFILFEILPLLQSGVLIHFHDVFYPFEYPKEWVYKGLNLNENYCLKTFLMYNQKFEILLFSEYLHKHHKQAYTDMPLCYKNPGGNLWIVKK
jgi:predicted O-methyltransferase YrrM